MMFFTPIFWYPRRLCRHRIPAGARWTRFPTRVWVCLPTVPAARWGKFATWISSALSPFGLVCVLAYSSRPDLSHNGKLIYAAVTYTLLTLLYTVVNIPYCALGA